MLAVRVEDELRRKNPGRAVSRRGAPSFQTLETAMRAAVVAGFFQPRGPGTEHVEDRDQGSSAGIPVPNIEDLD